MSELGRVFWTERIEDAPIWILGLRAETDEGAVFYEGKTLSLFSAVLLSVLLFSNALADGDTESVYPCADGSDFTIDSSGVITGYTGTDTDLVIPAATN